MDPHMSRKESNRVSTVDVASDPLTGVRVITLQRPTKRNAFDGALTKALDEALNDFEDDPTATVAVLTGGAQIFSAGSDVFAGAGYGTARGGSYGVTRRRLTKPLIVAVEGIAAGGGFEIALAATLVVASESATFVLPEVNLGLIAECGALFRGPRALPRNLARELLLTGQPLDARRAYQIGFVSELTAPGEALAGAARLAATIAARAPLSIRETLAALTALDDELDLKGWETTERARAVVRSSQDAVEGVAAFGAKRAPQWTGT